MYWLTMILAVAVGIAAGVLATLVIDGRIWGKLVQKAWSDVHQFQKRLREMTSHLTASATQVHNLSNEVYSLTKRVEDVSADNQTHRHDLATAVAKKEVYATQYGRLTGQLDKLRAEHQVSQRRLMVAAVELKRLRQNHPQLLEPAQATQKADEPMAKAVDEPAAEKADEKADGKIGEAQTSGLQAELHEFQRARKAAKTTKPKVESQIDPETESQVEAVNGIGPTYARRLHESGIHSLADLAQQTPETLSEIIGFKSPQIAKSQGWIDEARELAAAFSDGAEFGLQAVSPPRATNQ